MRRRFGRSRKTRSSSDSKGAPIDAARVFDELPTAGIVSATGLEPVGGDEIGSDFAVVGVGEGEAGKVVVGFAPKNGGNAALATIAVAQRLAAEEGFAGEAVAVAPQWTASARRRLGVLATASLPFRFRTLADASLGEGEAGVEVDAIGRAVGLSVPQIEAALTDAGDRTLFRRAAASLEGLAAKHAGSVRGVDSRLELILLARRVAALQVGEAGVQLETFEGERSTVALRSADIATAMDRLEGALRKRLNDRRVREGEDGLRAQLASVMVNAAQLRDAKLWPFGSVDGEVIDLVGVHEDGQPGVAAIRDRMDLSDLGAILDATLALAPSLPSLLRDAGAPLRFGPPRLVLAAQTYDASVLRVLSALGLSHVSFTVEQRRGRDPGLALHKETDVPVPVPVPSEARGPAVEAVEEKGAPEQPTGRGRGRGRRGGRRTGGDEAPAGEKSQRDSDAAEAQPIEEISLFDLADEPATGGNGSDEREGGRSRRGRGRGRRRRSGRGSDVGDGDEDAASESVVDASAGNGESEDEAVGDESRPSGRGRRRRRGRGQSRGEVEGDALDAAADADDLSETLAPIDEVPDL
jgi:hypothetical protein